ncbi:hypothetical protein AVEN_178934-1 [Araneus ventricosus]|uniref:Uncharacterized protein n=1 Tax=Araneus ventricosus TaxID=182803 RepID=A0A4Y2IWJ3_ARAVE|nr:hypothetical protein AVEN_178934-1 [Araneus ventricosus]
MHCRRLATRTSFDLRAIYYHNAGSNRCTYKPTSHFDSSFLMMGNNAGRLAVGTQLYYLSSEQIDVARGLVSASVASRVMAVNRSHVKGGTSGQTVSVHPFTRALPRDFQRRDWSEFLRPQSTSTNLEQLEDQDGPTNVFKKLSSVEDEESEVEDAAHAPPASVLHRRRALVPPKVTEIFSGQLRNNDDL